MSNLAERLIQVVPSERQIKWQELEFTAFFHYGINSFTDREWGDGKEDIQIFNPKALDTDQWCRCLLDAGIKACIITAKHHDGFCLWDTAYTTHSVMHTPFKHDIVADLSKSCKKYGIKLGVYLSPWDRHEKTYGQGKPYDDYFCNQLTELLTKYGELYTVWFDGACGEGENGKKQVYDWDRYYTVIRELQPNAVISVSGPDVRWCGNEAGDCRESEWSVVSSQIFSQDEIAKNSQQADNEEFRERPMDAQDRDLGSREVVQYAKKLIWYPAEVDTSIRPGWFYHEYEDDKVRSLSVLTDIYLKSVGGNSVLLLNIPPHRDGYISSFDETRLKEIGTFIKEAFQKNIVKNASISASSQQAGCEVHAIAEENETYWMPEMQDKDCFIEVSFDTSSTIKYCVLMEQIRKSQRVEKFHIKAKMKDGTYQTIYEGTTIGYKKICCLEEIETTSIRIIFEEYRVCPTIKMIGIYTK